MLELTKHMATIEFDYALEKGENGIKSSKIYVSREFVQDAERLLNMCRDSNRLKSLIRAIECEIV